MDDLLREVKHHNPPSKPLSSTSSSSSSSSSSNMRYFAHQVARITDNVYLSSVGGVTQERSLEEHAITHILNVARELSDLKYPHDHLKIHRVQLADTERENILPHLETLVDHVNDVAETGGHIAVHCIAGVSRSATVCIAYLVKYHHMTLKDAYRKVYKAREVIRPNRGFWTSLVAFEERYHELPSVEMLPWVCGVEPSVSRREMELRIRCGWMKELMMLWLFHLTLALIQVYFS